jgi:hypothetical protein
MDTTPPLAPPPAPAPAPPPPAQPGVSTMFQFIISKMASDMKFVGLFTIIIGGFYCITIIGALLGVPFIIAGIRLREAADSFMYYLSTKDMRMLENACERQSRYFNIIKILMIIALAILVLYIFFIIIFGLSMLRLMEGGFGV